MGLPEGALRGDPFEEVVDDAAWAAVRRRLPEHDLIVDALLGTGTRGAASGRMKEAIEAINGAGCDVVSVDIPSGAGRQRGLGAGCMRRGGHHESPSRP